MSQASQDALAADFRLAAMIRRAAVSVICSIAEGLERGAKTEFTRFVYTAKGSCGEEQINLETASMALTKGITA